MRDRVFYDREKLIVFGNGKMLQRCYFKDREYLNLRIIEKGKGIEYLRYNDSQISSKILPFIKLAGGIYLYPSYNSAKYAVMSRLYSKVIDGNYVHIEYDGITHLTIENNEYIYMLNLPYRADINIKYEYNMFFIRFCDDVERLIVVKRNIDYDVLLDIIGNSIKIEGNIITSTMSFNDSLGRIREDTYEIEDGSIKTSKSQFNYTYDIVYNDSFYLALVEDAIVAKDFDYISRLVSPDINMDKVKDYFACSLPTHTSSISMTSPNGNKMYLVDKYGDSAYAITITRQGGSITNFDIQEVDN